MSHETLKPQNLEDAATLDLQSKRDHWTRKLGYYDEKINELGLKTIDRFADYYPNPNQLIESRVVFAHRDLESVAAAMEENKPWAVISGLNPSGPLHFGHKLVFDELLWLQKQGADVYIPITNDESYLVDKTRTLEESRKIAYEDVIPSIVAMGFDPKKTHIFVDSDYPDIYNLAMKLSKHVSLNRIYGVFGFGKDEEKENPGTLFYRGAVQLAQILLPQLAEFGGSKPTLIPVGIDQYPYVLLSRDVARRTDLIPPSALFLKFAHGLDGKGKMSTTRKESAIFLNDEIKTVEKKIRTAYTGGSISSSYQKEHGGVPGICPIYHLRTYHFETDNHVEEQCVRGEILCGECKRCALDQVTGFLIDHQSRLEDAKKNIDQFILRTRINSFLK